jgi:PAS domain S-box-containing protein
MENLKEPKEKLTDWQQREKYLEHRITELEDFMENAAMPMHWVDGSGTIIWANQAELDLLGYSKEQYIGYPIRDFHADQEAIQHILSLLINNETLRDHPSILRCKDGTLKNVLINSNVLRRDGQFIHTRCLTRDVTVAVEEEKIMKALLTDLEQSRARLRMATESTGLGTWEYHLLTGELDWSAECRHIYGIAPDAPVDFKLFEDHIFPEDKPFVSDQIQKALDPEGNGLYDITFRIFRVSDNNLRWIRSQGKVYFGTDQQTECFIGTVIDITENKLAYEKISRSEKLFRSIALNIPDSLVVVVDKDRRFLVIEGDLIEKMGYDNKDFIGKHPGEVGPVERYDAVKDLYDRMLAGESFSVERKSATGDDYMVHFVALKNDDGEVDAGLIIALDISAIKQAEEKSAKLAAIIESSDDAIISKTLDGIITSWNDAAVRMFGFTAVEMIGQPILKLIPADRQEEEPRILSRLRSGERVEHFETRRLTKDGGQLDVSLTISPVKDPRGNITGVSKIARDITEKKQEELRKNDFIALVSHELKTPLTSLKSYIQVLLARAQKEGDSFRINALTRADIQAKKMTTMIKDFLNLARLEDGKISLSKTLFELFPLIEEIASEAQFITSNHTIQLISCGKVFLFADQDKIGQVLTNLLSNAIKYSPKGGTITIGCEKNDGKIKVYVRDQGVGISPEDQKRLFERFYRVKNEKIKSVSGFGIGLYLVAELLRYHSSEIKVKSEEGAGSTFYFVLEIP